MLKNYETSNGAKISNFFTIRETGKAEKNKAMCNEGMAICAMDVKMSGSSVTGTRFRCCILPETNVLISEGKLRHTRKEIFISKNRCKIYLSITKIN